MIRIQRSHKEGGDPINLKEFYLVLLLPEYGVLHNFVAEGVDYLKIFDSIHAYNIKDSFVNMSFVLVIVTKQYNGYTIMMSKIFKSTSNVYYTTHKVDSCEETLTATKK
jgi:hypothetical protein